MIWLEALKYSPHLSDFVSAMKSCDGQEVYRECSSGGRGGQAVVKLSLNLLQLSPRTILASTLRDS